VRFGVFLPNGKNGYIISSGSPQYDPTYEHNKQISIEAERQGFDLVLSMMKYRGFGGETGYWDACLESFTLMAALAVETSRVELYPSVTLLAHHPAIVARMVATIDDISNGRCGLNIVTGWNKPEYSQMGLWRGDEYYNQRYQYAREYLEVVKALWRDGSTTHHSENFNLEDCMSMPKPKHSIPIVCAGMSPAGMEFTAEMGDYNFVFAPKEKLKQIVPQVKQMAEKNNRKVGTYALFHLIAAETESEARRFADDIVAQADRKAIDNVVASSVLDTNTDGTSQRQRESLEKHYEEGNTAFMSIPVLVGSYRGVAAQLDELAEVTGIDGALFSFPDFVASVRDFGEKIMPHLTTGARS
jgi:pyrimidine oxygenase